MKPVLCLSFLLPFLFLGLAPDKLTADQQLPESLPAFPGAEGFGSTTPGGRGGRVIRVTNLNPRGLGSLQEACSAEGPRIVVFDTSGVINGDVVIEHGRISIMGQTAPGAGITIRGRLMTRYGEQRHSDIVVRFLRVRPDPATGVSGDAVQFSRVDNCVMDHVSCAWGNDEVVDIYNAHDITIQWCMIEESDTEGHDKGVHNFGLINGPEGGRVSIHHNLFAHHRRRCPAIAHGPSDVRNNVIYNFRDGFSHEGHVPNNLGFNIIGNYYKTGPSDPNIFPFCFVPDVFYYLRENYFEGRNNTYTGIIQDPWAEADSLYGLRYYADRGGIRAEQEYPVPRVTTHTPQAAFELVLDLAGCFPRDTVGRRTVVEVLRGTGSWGRHESGDLMTGLTTALPPLDSDGDGMPDSWERAKGLNPLDPGDHKRIMPSGYTAIEEYCNVLADGLIEHRGSLPAKGDLDMDGNIGIFDLLALLKNLQNGVIDWASDMNYDGKVDIFDLLELLRALSQS